MKKYLITTILVSIFFLAAYYLHIGAWFHDYFPVLIAFFFFQSLVVSWIFYLGEKNDWKTPIYALGAITFRLMTGLFFLAILFMIKPAEIKALMIQFIVLYLVYLIFELFAVLPNLRRN